MLCRERHHTPQSVTTFSVESVTSLHRSVTSPADACRASFSLRRLASGHRPIFVTKSTELVTLPSHGVPQRAHPVPRSENAPLCPDVHQFAPSFPVHLHGDRTDCVH